MATSSSKAKTQYIKSKKYTGISHRTTDNDTIYYCSYKTKKGNYSRFKCGYKSAGYSEKLAYEYLQSEKQKILNDIDTHSSTKKSFKGASKKGSSTTYWLIEENGNEFSIQLKSSDIDIYRKGLLSKYIGKTIYIEVDINRKDGVIISKKINEIFTKDTHSEYFI